MICAKCRLDQPVVYRTTLAKLAVCAACVAHWPVVVTGICANGECGELLDHGGVAHVDKSELKIVLLCTVCADQMAATQYHRYERFNPPPEEEVRVYCDARTRARRRAPTAT